MNNHIPNSSSTKDALINVRHFSDTDLLNQFGKLVRTERKITSLVLECIAEIDARKLYLDKAYSSLYEFLVKEFGYSPSAAMRRIESARLLREVPALAEQIESGALNLSQVSKVQQALRTVQRLENRKLETSEKMQLLSRIENTSYQQTEVILCQALSIPVIVENKQRTHGDESVTLTVTFTKEQFNILRRSQDLSAHALPEGNWAEAITYLAKKEIQRRTKTNSKKAPSPTSSEYYPKAISTSDSDAAAHKPLQVSVKKTVLNQQGHCQFKDPATGKICGSTRFLQIDHKQPVWAGGTNEIGNLQVLCAQHNQLKYRNENSMTLKSDQVNGT